MIELLVVIGIIAILASLLLPALSAAKSKARQIQCLGNQKQLALTWTLYADDHNERLAPNGYGTPESLGTTKLWVLGGTHQQPDVLTNVDYLVNPQYAAFASYLRTPSIYKCPADPAMVELAGKPRRTVRSYALNGYMGWQEPHASFNSGNYVTFQKSSEITAAGPSSQIYLFSDMAPASICHAAFVVSIGVIDGWYYHVPSSEHNRSGVLSFADGHAASQRWREQSTLELGTRHFESHFQYAPGNRDLRWLQEHATVVR